MNTFFNGNKNVFGITKSRRHKDSLIEYFDSMCYSDIANILENEKFIMEINEKNGQRHPLIRYLIDHVKSKNNGARVYRGRSYDLAKDVIREVEPKLTVFTGNDLALNCAMYDGLKGENGMLYDIKNVLKSYKEDDMIELEWKNGIDKKMEMTILKQSGNPRLCFMIPKEMKMEDIFEQVLDRDNEILKISMDGIMKYGCLAESFYYNHLQPQFKIAKDEKITCGFEGTEGDAEYGPKKGISDAVVAVVDSGRTYKDAGLKIFDEIGPTYLVSAKCFRNEKKLF
ncbi:MAG TPA: hypothetical protein VJB11_03120 [archaeon]|nr:hypothetical protein [archaeon]